MSAPKPYLLFDVDGTIANGRPIPHTRARPGIRLTFQLLHSLGYDVDLWSKAGGAHCADVADYLGLPVDRVHDKPTSTMAIPALASLDPHGRAPVMQIDNEAGDRIGVWPFHHVDSWWGEPEAAETRQAKDDVEHLGRKLYDALEALREAYAANRGDDHYVKNGEIGCVECDMVAGDCWASRVREVLNG